MSTLSYYSSAPQHQVCNINNPAAAFDAMMMWQQQQQCSDYPQQSYYGDNNDTNGRYHVAGAHYDGDGSIEQSQGSCIVGVQHAYPAAPQHHQHHQAAAVALFKQPAPDNGMLVNDIDDDGDDGDDVEPDLMHIQEETDYNDDAEILDVLCTMRRHPHDINTLTTSFHTLWVLSYDTDNARAIGGVGGLPILLNALRSHLHSHLNINHRYNRDKHTSSPSSRRQMRLHKNGMAALQNLSVIKYNADSIGNNESIPYILKVMETFCDNPDIVCSGCNALANIMSNNNGNGNGGSSFFLSNNNRYQQEVLRNGGLELITKSVQEHDPNVSVLEAAYKCLSLLGQTSVWKEFGGNTGNNDASSQSFCKMEDAVTDCDTSSSSGEAYDRDDDDVEEEESEADGISFDDDEDNDSVVMDLDVSAHNRQAKSSI